MPKISIIIPCYFNELNVPITSKKLIENEVNFPKGTQFEYVMVDDGSKDNTFQELLNFHRQYPERMKIIKLASNVGSYNAILAGMKHATGDCCCTISADLQDPVELIPQMFSYWLKGIKLVMANREKREEPLLQRIFSEFYHYMVRKFALSNIPSGGFDVVLFDRKLNEEVIKMNEKNTNTLYLLPWLGYEYVVIPYTRKKREIGKSRWTLSKKIKLFVDSFVSFSFFPIRAISFLGFFLAFLAIIYMLVIFISNLFGVVDVKGWTTIMILILVVSSFQMIALGIIGEYVWRTLDAIRNRPIYIIDEIIDTK